MSSVRSIRHTLNLRIGKKLESLRQFIKTRQDVSSGKKTPALPPAGEEPNLGTEGALRKHAATCYIVSTKRLLFDGIWYTLNTHASSTKKPKNSANCSTSNHRLRRWIPHKGPQESCVRLLATATQLRVRIVWLVSLSIVSTCSFIQIQSQVQRSNPPADSKLA